jgi:hypothetical protein
MIDPVIDLVAQLPHAMEDPERAHKTRARCHRILATRAPVAGAPRPHRWPSWSPALIGLAGLYFAETVWRLAQVYAAR